MLSKDYATAGYFAALDQQQCGWKPDGSHKKEKNVERCQSSQGKGQGQSKNMNHDKDDDKEFLREVIQKQSMQITEFQVQVAKLVAEVQALRTQLANGGGPIPSSSGASFKAKPERDGWIPVKSSKKEKDEEKTQVPLQLRSMDWPVPIIEPSDFKDGASGVAMVSNKDGEQIAKEVSQCSGQMAVIASKDIPNRMSRAIEVKALTKEGRLVRVDRFITNVGDKEVTARYEAKKEINECTMHVPNNMCKIVIQLQGRFLSIRAIQKCQGSTSG